MMNILYFFSEIKVFLTVILTIISVYHLGTDYNCDFCALCSKIDRL